jgi:uncharacterized protein
MQIDTETERMRGGQTVMLGIALALPTVVTWLYFVALADQSPAVQQTAYSIGKGVQFLLPVGWILLARQRLSWQWLTMRGVPLGLVFGLVLLVAAWVGYALLLKPMGVFDAPSAAIRAKIAGLGLASVPAYIVLGVFYSLVHSLLEEYYWRWFVFGRLCERYALHWGIVLSSLGFAAHHVLLLATFFGWDSPATYLFSACVAVGGAFWAWLYRQSGSLIGPWLSHAIVDATLFVIGYDLARDLFR